jgi:NAD-dependent SIR2 family protein deacetylase
MAYKDLQHFPKPVLDDLVTGRWLPVVGAGMSLNATVPAGKKMPLWSDLGKELADELKDFSAISVLDGISAYQHEFGRARLIERLSELLFIRDAQPGNAHRAFCTIPFDIVCTTNFDFLLERQYDLTPRYVYPVVDEEQLSVNAGNAGTLLLKLHGDLRHPGRTSALRKNLIKGVAARLARCFESLQTCLVPRYTIRLFLRISFCRDHAVEIL